MTDIPRRCRVDLYSPGEKAIHKAISAVEAMGAAVALTDAVVLLSKAKDRVADYVDCRAVDLPKVGSVNSSANQPTYHFFADAIKYSTDKPTISIQEVRDLCCPGFGYLCFLDGGLGANDAPMDNYNSLDLRNGREPRVYFIPVASS